VTLETPLDEWERILERKRGRVHAAEHALHVLATEEVRVNTALEPYRLRMEELHQSFDGDKQALQAFLPNVPHDVETLVALRAPLQLVRESGTGISALDGLDLPR
jgi:hypothetical protein